MSKSKYTKGPWHVSEGNIRPNLVYAANNYLIADCNTKQAESDINARLVASAPVMLELLRSILLWANNPYDERGTSWFEDQIMDVFDQIGDEEGVEAA